MKRCLNDYMQQAKNKREIHYALDPCSRVVHIKTFQTTIDDTIESVISMIRHSIEHHNQPFKIVLSGSAKPLLFPNSKDSGTTNKIVLLLTLLKLALQNLRRNEVKTVRDVFYSNVELFINQRRVQYWLSIILKCFQLPSKDCLNIIAAQKGLCYTCSQIDIETRGIQTSIRECSSMLIPYLRESSKITIPNQKTHKMALIVVEKEALYNKLIENKEDIPSNTIIVTGKGYPDFLTRLFLNKLQNCTQCIQSWSIYTDADPHGIDIALKYMHNDVSPSYKCESLEYKGVRLSDLLRHKCVQFLMLSQRDVSLAIRLLDTLILHPSFENQLYITELQRQLFFNKKAEMNVLSKNYFLSTCQSE